MLAEADKLQHRFASEDKMTIQEYLDKRLQLYNEAGEIDDDAQVRRLHGGLDPLLAALIDLNRETTNKVSELKTKIATKEHSARAAWKQQQTWISQSARRYDERPRNNFERTRYQEGFQNRTY